MLLQAKREKQFNNNIKHLWRLPRSTKLSSFLQGALHVLRISPRIRISKLYSTVTTERSWTVNFNFYLVWLLVLPSELPYIRVIIGNFTFLKKHKMTRNHLKTKRIEEIDGA